VEKDAVPALMDWGVWNATYRIIGNLELRITAQSANAYQAIMSQSKKHAPYVILLVRRVLAQQQLAV
jgi:hypothetical protein